MASSCTPTPRLRQAESGQDDPRSAKGLVRAILLAAEEEADEPHARDESRLDSFASIAQQKDTSLAVVAPSIAEALIATALGLAAAIPAVVAYNQVAVSLSRASAKANTSIAEIAKQLSRPQARPMLQSAAE
jgi:hypothetical protein